MQLEPPLNGRAMERLADTANTNVSFPVGPAVAPGISSPVNACPANARSLRARH
jgi:hypothetical protein